MFANEDKYSWQTYSDQSQQSFLGFRFALGKTKTSIFLLKEKFRGTLAISDQSKLYFYMEHCHESPVVIPPVSSVILVL